MPVFTCSYPGCNNQDRNTFIRFFKFPQDDAMRTAWVQALGREDWKPSDSSRVCSCHFKGTAYTDGNRIDLKPEATPMKVPGARIKKDAVVKGKINETPAPWLKGTCFLCDKDTDEGISLQTPTNTTKTPLHEMLSVLVNTGDVMFAVDENGMLCRKCAYILNYKDRIASQKTLTTTALFNKMCMRYGIMYFDDESLMFPTSSVEFSQGDSIKLEVDMSSVLASK